MSVGGPAPDWYAERPEPEQRWRGVLRPAASPVGPAARGGLDYKLITAERRLPLYTPHLAPALASLAGHEVVVCGKLVDLSPDGLGEELWPVLVEEAAR